METKLLALTPLIVLFAVFLAAFIVTKLRKETGDYVSQELPGFCFHDSLDEKLTENIIDFIELRGKTGDVGGKNLKSQLIADITGKEIEQIESDDFNFHVPFAYRPFDTILCLEVLEHLQNPLFFLKELAESLAPEGTIYLSTPHRPRILWTTHHFFEFGPEHLTKWIFTPAGLKVGRHKYLRSNHPTYFYVTGIRPFLRLFFNYTVIYELKKI